MKWNPGVFQFFEVVEFQGKEHAFESEWLERKFSHDAFHNDDYKRKTQQQHQKLFITTFVEHSKILE